MFNVYNSGQTLVVTAALSRSTDHKNPIEIHGIAATTKSPISSAMR
jgi:hypothetical protein